MGEIFDARASIEPSPCASAEDEDFPIKHGGDGEPLDAEGNGELLDASGASEWLEELADDKARLAPPGA